MKIFISYSSIDTKYVLKLVRILKELQIDYHIDIKDIKWGESIDEKIELILSQCSHLVVVISPASLDSTWVIYEVGFAKGKNITILPLLTHVSLKLPLYLQKLHHLSSLHQVKQYFKDNSACSEHDKLMSEKTYFKYRDVEITAEQKVELVDFLEKRYKVKAFAFQGFKLPVTVLWQNLNQIIEPNKLLGSLDSNEPAKMAKESERNYIKQICESGNIKRESINYRMLKLNLDGKYPKIFGSLGYYYDNLLTQYAMEWELKSIVDSSKSIPQLRKLLKDSTNMPLRSELEYKLVNPITDGNFRCAALTISMFFVFKRENDYYCTVCKRSKDVSVDPDIFHVAPAGMFEAANKDYIFEWSIEYNIFRELLEEVYNVQEVSSPSPGTSDYLYNIAPLPHLISLIKNKKAILTATGICKDLLNMRTEICTLLLVKDKSFMSERKMELNWEYNNEYNGNFVVKLDQLNSFIHNTIGSKISNSGAVTLTLGNEWVKNNLYKSK